MSISLLFFLCLLYPIVLVSSQYFSAHVTNDGPVVLGANITFRAEVLKNGKKDQSNFDFVWLDNMSPQNRFNNTHQGVSTWTVHHSPDSYTPGIYTVEVRVYKYLFVIDWPLCYARKDFTLEQYLVGKLVLKQNGTAQKKYVSNAVNLQHKIELNPSDMKYLELEVEKWRVDWYIDTPAQPVNTTFGNLFWSHPYNEADVSHVITAHIIGYRKKHNATIDSSRLVSEVETFSSTKIPDVLKLNNSIDSAKKEKLSYSTFSNSSSVDSFGLPVECHDSKKTVCGVFSRNITVKAPVNHVSVSGSNWLQHGDMLNLQLTCNGSAPFDFCVKFIDGAYKVVGNESCKFYSITKPTCDFSVTHYFRNSSLHTVLMIVSNDINKNITAIGVNIYEVTKHPQLSIIVVPLTASILAIILIIFGVAFYLTNRNSYAIEVADFDFTNNNDIEYKTFKERLTEAIHNALNKPEEFSEEDSYNGVPSTSNKKYGSMQ